MPIVLAFEPMPRYLLVVGQGPAQVDDFVEMSRAVTGEARRRGAKRLLLDLRGLEPLVSEGDVLFMAEHAVIVFRDFVVASVVAPGERRGTTETVAREEGVSFRTFIDIEQATTWLLDHPGLP